MQCINKNSDAFSFYSPQLNTYVIVYSDNRLLRRIRFTLMHEIGHIKMGHKGESDLAKKMADYYAGYALAPFPLINLLPSNSICDISSAFSVSSECASVSYAGFQNWKQYGEKRLKDYEVRLINLFK